MGPVIAGICIVELEHDAIPELSIKVSTWEHYVHDRIAYIKTDAID